MEKEDEITLTPSASAEVKNTPMTLQAKVCLAISLAILSFGCAILTNIHLFFLPLVKLAIDNQLATIIGIVGSFTLIVCGWLAYKYPLIGHFNKHAFLFGFFVVALYFLSVRQGFTGQPYVTVWAPILIEIGMIALAACITRHDPTCDGIKDFGDALVAFQTIVVLSLFAAYIVFDTEAQRRRNRDLEAYFSELHVDTPARLSEVIEFQGARFTCLMDGGAARCSKAGNL